MSLIDRFLTNTYEVKRSRPGTYSGGFYQDGGFDTIQVRGSLQPLTGGREIKMPEEGNRLKQYYKFYTDAPLLLDNTRSLAGADIITVNGDTFKVLGTEQWQGLKVDLPHYKSMLVREPEQ